MKLITIIFTSFFLINSYLFCEVDQQQKIEYVGNLRLDTNQNFPGSFSTHKNQININEVKIGEQSLSLVYSGIFITNGPPDKMVNNFTNAQDFQFTAEMHLPYRDGGSGSFDPPEDLFLSLTSLPLAFSYQSAGLGKFIYTEDSWYKVESRKQNGFFSFGNHPTPKAEWQTVLLKGSQHYEGEVIDFKGQSGQVWLDLASDGTMMITFEIPSLNKVVQQQVHLSDSDHATFSDDLDTPFQGQIQGIFYGKEATEIAGTCFFVDSTSKEQNLIGFILKLVK